MGMYTEVFARAEITKETYTNLLQIEGGFEPPKGAHPFWKTPRWSSVFHGESFYFPMGGRFQLTERGYDFGTYYYLSLRSSLKNYDNEIELFFDWLSPLSLTDGFLGYSLYEESDTPTLFYKGYQFRPKPSEPADFGWARSGGYYD